MSQGSILDFSDGEPKIKINGRNGPFCGKKAYQ